MNIQHDPITDIEKVIKHYSERDGVDIKYVCTSAIQEGNATAADIFYRDTPHPQFGNRYFGLFYRYIDEINNPQLMITSADNVENLDFNMVDNGEELVYSQHRHDFRKVSEDVYIDGGRAYLRLSYNKKPTVKLLKVRDGEFYESEDRDVS